MSKHPLPAPAFWAAVAFGLGIFLASLLTQNLLFWLTSSLLFGLLAGGFHAKQNSDAANGAFLLLFISLGGLRYASATDVVAGRSVANFVGLGRPILISGRVCELPDVREHRTRLFLDEVEIGWKEKIPLEGKIILSIGKPVSRFGLGNRISFAGLLDSLWPPANPGALDYARYMQIRGVDGAMYLKDDRLVTIGSRSLPNWRKKWEEFRTSVHEKLGRGLPPEAAAIVFGFVLGDTRQIKPETFDLFRKTGTVHLLAVSGANVAWVALLPLLLLKVFYVSLRWRYVVALIAVWLFVMLTDMQASVLRAAVMFSFWTASKILYREVSGLQTWGLSGLFLLLVNPLWFFDIGFQLSYLATFALIFSFTEKEEIEKGRLKRRFDWVFWNNAKSSAAVFLLITPLLAYYFNLVSWASLLVNIAAIPLAALMTWSSLLAGVAGFFTTQAPLAVVQTNLFEYLFLIQNWFGNLPHFFMRVAHPSVLESSLLTFAGFGLLAFLFKPDYRKTGIYLFLAGLIPVIWFSGFKRAPEFELTVLEARGEVAALLSLGDKTYLIGGGRMEEGRNTPEQVLEPALNYLGKSKIDGFIPLRFDSTGQAASAKIREEFGLGSVDSTAALRPVPAPESMHLLKVEYLQKPADSIPFGLRIGWRNRAFLFFNRPIRWPEIKTDSLLPAPAVLVGPFDSTVWSLPPSKAPVVVSIRRPPKHEGSSSRVFFLSRDGAVTFRLRNGRMVATSHLSKRKIEI